MRALSPRLYEYAGHYTKTVIAVGYAVLLGVWSFADTYMPPRPHAATGVLAIISACIFVLWEVYINVSAARMYKTWVQKLQQEPAQDALRNLLAYDDELRRANLGRAVGWYAVLLLTLLTGLGSAAILVFHGMRFILRG